MNQSHGQTEQFDGHAFHEQLPKGRASGQLALGTTHLSFNSDAKSVSLPLTDIRIKMGGANNRLVFFEHPSYPDWSLYTADRDILKSEYLSNHNELIQQVNTAKGTRILGWAGFGAGLILVVLLPLMVFLSMDTISGWVAPAIPADVEQKLGDSAWSQVETNSTVLEDLEVTESLQRLIAPLLSAAQNERYEFNVHIIESSELNAFALPGGNIAINTGLILAAQSSEEVLGVLAHEIIHVTEQHGVRNVIGTAGIVVMTQALFGDFTGLLGVLVDAGPVLLRLSYSRQFESEADNKGFDLLVKANIDPRGMPAFFTRIIEDQAHKKAKTEDEPDGDLEQMSNEYLSSHPQTLARIKAIEKRLATLNQSFTHSNYDLNRLQQAIKNTITLYPSDLKMRISEPLRNFNSRRIGTGMAGHFKPVERRSGIAQRLPIDDHRPARY
jgi:Zn-dependent protease with chaperone function